MSKMHGRAKNIRNGLCLGVALAGIVLLIMGVRIMMGLREEVAVMPIKVVIGRHVGFNVETETLNFGTMLPGARGERSVMVRADHDALVTLEVQGIEWITVAENSFINKAGTPKKILVIAEPPENISEGSYSGQLIIISGRR